LDKIQQLAEVYSHNACTPDIHNYLVDRVKAVGLFGMMRECTVPLMHGGIKLGPYQAGADLEKLSMCPADAEAYLQELLGKVQSCNAAIFGELPSSSTPPLLLQSVVDLVCCNWERLKLLQSAPAGQQAAAGLRSAADAVTTALQAAAAVAAATARGDTAAAEAAAVTAQQAAAVAEQQAQQLAAAEDQEVLLPEELPEPPELPLPPAASGEQPAAADPGMLGRGTGLVYLLSNDWGGRAKLLRAAVKIADKVFTHITLGMLTARKGVNLEQQKQVPLRVALDFVSEDSSSSSWGPQAVTVPHNAHLLLWAKPLQTIPGRVSSTKVLPGYEVLYGDALGSPAIASALGEWCQPLSKRIHTRTPLVELVQQGYKRSHSCRMDCMNSKQFVCGTLLASHQIIVFYVKVSEE
jgi:hypothetical protein